MARGKRKGDQRLKLSRKGREIADPSKVAHTNIACYCSCRNRL
jgi:hypothetical protein